ncbi:MAG TPA: AAA family ATPase [Nostocaceae cyanobacterium]|nr:AAA family ATPase [Nostocaceae cyanobacterium]
MLSKILLKFGSSPNRKPLEFEPGTMTVFVGTNNSGKSLILREIEHYTEAGYQEEHNILDKLEFVLPSEEEVRKIIHQRKYVTDDPPPYGLISVVTIQPHDGEPTEKLIHLEFIIEAIRTGECTREFCENFIFLLKVRLDGRTRFALTEKRSSGDLQNTPTNHLLALFKDDKAREKIRNITADAFGLYFVIDPTGMNNLRIRMSSRPPQDSTEEQALDQRARDFHGQAKEISQFSDGIKAFTGIIAAVISTDYKIILLDEPEAFLHPPLAKKLGRRLTEIAAERQSHILASTHSSDFLMGCIQSGEKVNIVRLTYKQNIATARILPSEKIQEMMRDPLLRSTGVLSTLFYEGAIVGEADRDRAFYQEINERLLACGEKGIDNCVFLNAQNWQTIHRIIRPLREMGIPAAAIVDIDVLKGDTTPFRDLLKAAFVPQPLIDTWGVLRGNVRVIFENLNLKLKEGGISLLSGGDRETTQNLLNNFSEYGIFIVPNGEVESWLSDLKVTGDKSDWLIKVFEKMGTDPSDPNYLKPQNGDVWDFIKNVASWIANPLRKGMSE